MIGVGFLLELIARGENRLFSPVKSGRFVFAEQKEKLSAKLTAYKVQVFRLRRKTATEQKEIASGRNIQFGAIRGSRAANHDLCETGAAERPVFPKGVNVPLLPGKSTF